MKFESTAPHSRKTTTLLPLLSLLTILLLPMILSPLLTGCKQSSDDDGIPTTAKYACRMNYNDTYHLVYEYRCIINADSTYTVTSATLHYFSIKGYSTKTGDDLIKIAQEKKIPATTKTTGTALTEEKKQNWQSSTGATETLILPKGLAPQQWAYKTFTSYAYKMDFDDTYHRVTNYIGTDNGDNTYEVCDFTYHYFAKSNANYKDRTGSELCDMVKTGAVTPSSSVSYTLSDDTNHTVNNSKSPTGKDTFHIYKGQKFTRNYYF